MLNVSLADVLRVTNGDLIKGDKSKIIKNVSIDTRTLKQGDLFICINGSHYNGHFFVGEAVRKGAAGILAARQEKVKVSDHVDYFIEVEDTGVAVMDLGYFIREQFSGEVIGVTGSVGKTTTKDFIKKILNHKFNVHASRASYNNKIGIPLTMFGLEQQHEICIVEIGTNHQGEIEELSKSVKPDVGIITRIGPSHIGNFGSIDNILNEKFSMIKHIHENGSIILNSDDKFLNEIDSQIPIRKILVGSNAKCDFQAVRVKKEGRKAFYRIIAKPFASILETELPVLGQHNVYSLLIAIAVAYGFGMSTESILDGIKSIKLPDKRLQVIEVSGRSIINDSYNANPISMEAALQVLQDYDVAGRKIFVTGDMKELGSWSQHYHYELGGNIPKYGVEKVIAIGEWAEDVRRGAVDNGFNSEDFFISFTNNEIVKLLDNVLEPEDVVLVKGSRQMHLEEIVHAVIEYYKTLDSLII